MRFLVFIACFISFTAHAQDTRTSGRQHLDTLASDGYAGRGYVRNGYAKAVSYVERQYKALKLKPYGKQYIQPFTYPVNTFPDSMRVSIGKTTLKPGMDYIVAPESGSDEGEFTPVYYDPGKFFLKHEPVFSGHEIIVVQPWARKPGKDTLELIRRRLEKFNREVPVMQLTGDKLTWSVGDEAYPHARIQVKAEAYDTTAKSISLSIRNVFNPAFGSANVVGYVPAKKRREKKCIVVTAHLDHLGMMGDKAVFNGANDNASGVSMLLTLAGHYAKTKPEYNMVFIAFGGEEAGLIGSKYYTENPLFPLSNIGFLLNIDLMANGQDGVTVVNATKFEKQFALFKQVNDDKQLLKQVKARGEAANSDHYWFTQKGVPAFFVYTMGGSTAYHDVFDRPENLPLEQYNAVQEMMVQFLDAIAKSKI